MTLFSHGRFVEELRRRRGKIPQDLYDDLVASLEAGLGAAPPRDLTGEPAWLVEARRHMGLKEIPGRAHNPKIIQFIKELGGWFTDDETPWCGTFVAACMLRAGHSALPKHWYRAKDWVKWGKPTPPRLGAIAVFGRKGGGHVGFLVGESASNLYVLGGNQGNEVNISPIAKTRLLDIRWPTSQPLSTISLAAMSGGKISRNEA